MPELPEVETTRLGLMPLVQQTITQVIIRNGALRWPIPQHLPELLQGKTLHALSRRAKYILAHFDEGVLLLHLGMSGRICLLEQMRHPKNTTILISYSAMDRCCACATRGVSVRCYGQVKTRRNICC